MDGSAADFLPPKRTLTALRRASAACRGCPLWKDATQTVFGKGPARAELKWRPRGKRRLHQTPRAGEVEAVRPRAIVALGATAAKALFGPSVRVTRNRGRILETP
jgi:uracil-DNA glycosylase